MLFIVPTRIYYPVSEIKVVALYVCASVEKLGNFPNQQIIKIAGAVLTGDLVQNAVVVGGRKKSNEGRQGNCNQIGNGFSACGRIKQMLGGKGQQRRKAGD